MKRMLYSGTMLLAAGALLLPGLAGCKPPTARKPSSARTGASASISTPVPADEKSSPKEKELSKEATIEKNESDGPAVPAVKPEEKSDKPTAPTDKPEEKPEPKKEAPTSSKTDEKTKEPAVQTARAEFKPAIDKTANAPVKAGDWNQWGGTSYRNNTPIAKNVPTEWNPGTFDRKTGKWKQNGEKIKWVAQVGSQTYGNPVICGGKILIGTNNTSGFLKRYPDEVDLGVALCFDEKTGNLLWQHSCEKLPTGRVHDWPQQGICAAAYMEGDKAWLTTSRGEIVCLDTNGFHDGEDDGEKNLPAKMFELMKAEEAAMDKVAPAIEELNKGTLPASLHELFAKSGMTLPEGLKVTVGEAGKKWTMKATVEGAERDLFITAAGPRLMGFKVLSPADKDESDVIWTFDMMKELGSSQHNMCSTSITCFGDILFCCTGNGVDESHINIPAPKAPSFFALDKNTKKVLWTDNTPGENIIHGQWSSPAVAKLGGVDQVIYGGGDGWLYSFKADAGQDGKPTLLWKFDLNPKEAKWVLGGRGTRNEPIGTPVVYDGLVYIAVGQDPEHAEGIGHIYCIDPTHRGDVSEVLAVKRADPKQIVPPRRLVGVIEEEGEIAIPNPNSACVWHYRKEDRNGDGKFDFEEEMHRTIGTVAIANDLLFIADFSGVFHCLNAKTGKVNWAYDMLAASWGSPLIADGHVYMGDEDGDVVIFNLSDKQHDPVTEINMLNSIYSTPVYANGVLYISNKTHIFAIQDPDGAEVAKK